MVAKSAWRMGGWAWTKVKKVVVERDRLADGGCRICPCCGVNEDDATFHIDHIVPCRNGGREFDLDNLWSLCEGCNLGFGAKPKEPVIEQMALALARARNRMPERDGEE